MPRGQIHRRLARIGVALAAVTAIAGCSLLPGADRDPPQLYDLTPKSTFSKDLPRIRAQLLIEVPTASAGITSSRIAIKPSPTTLEYFADSEWTDVAPKVVQTLLIESFDNAGSFSGIERDGSGLRTDYLVKADLREFQAELYADRPPVVRVRIHANLVRWSNREIISGGKFEAAVPITDKQIGAIVIGFDDALGKVLKRLVEWVTATVNADIRRYPIVRY